MMSSGLLMGGHFHQRFCPAHLTADHVHHKIRRVLVLRHFKSEAAEVWQCLRRRTLKQKTTQTRCGLCGPSARQVNQPRSSSGWNWTDWICFGCARDTLPCHRPPEEGPGRKPTAGEYTNIRPSPSCPAVYPVAYEPDLPHIKHLGACALAREDAIGMSSQRFDA
jgi:hypothetical protein